MSVTYHAALADLKARFRYRSDVRESWQILKSDNYIFGDCEDHVLTHNWLANGKSMLRFWLSLLMFKAVIWYCRAPSGEGHAVMWVRGHGWTDNIQSQFVTRKALKAKGYKLRYPYPAPTVALKMLLGKV